MRVAGVRHASDKRGQNDLIDVLYVACNRRAFTEHTLDMLIDNTAWPLVNKLWLWDDGSTDGTDAVLEAAWAAAALGVRVALVTVNPDRIGMMPCNPAVGGPGKSQLVAEVVALGGLMGRAADAAAIRRATTSGGSCARVLSRCSRTLPDGGSTNTRTMSPGIFSDNCCAPCQSMSNSTSLPPAIAASTGARGVP